VQEQDRVLARSRACRTAGKIFLQQPHRNLRKRPFSIAPLTHSIRSCPDWQDLTGRYYTLQARSL